jgi:hypothetical protein
MLLAEPNIYLQDTACALLPALSGNSELSFISVGDIFVEYARKRSSNLQVYGENNFLFTALEWLLRLHIVQLHFELSSPHSPEMAYKDRFHYGKWEIENLRLRWQEIRDALMSCKKILLMLPQFIDQAYNSRDKKFMQTYQDIITEYEAYVKELENLELYLKDRISLMSPELTVEMADLSIKESKRVLLCKLKLKA